MLTFAGVVLIIVAIMAAFDALDNIDCMSVCLPATLHMSLSGLLGLVFLTAGG